MIVTMGDSHATHAFRDIPGIRTISVGPTLLYSVGRDGISRVDITKHNINKGDHVIFSFGEIDCRCHIAKYIHTQPYNTIIDDAVIAYLKVQQQNIAQIDGVKGYVYSIPPPCPKEIAQNNPAYPFLGTNEDRVMYAKYMNYKLKTHCPEYNLTFIDVYDKYCDANGLLNMSYSDGNVHIDNAIFLKDVLAEIGLV